MEYKLGWCMCDVIWTNYDRILTFSIINPLQKGILPSIENANSKWLIMVMGAIGCIKCKDGKRPQQAITLV